MNEIYCCCFNTAWPWPALEITPVVISLILSFRKRWCKVFTANATNVSGAWTHASTEVLLVSTSAVLRLPLCRQVLNREGGRGWISARNVFELLQRASVYLGVCWFVLTSLCVSPCPGAGQLPAWTDSPAVRQHMDPTRVHIVFMGWRVEGWQAVDPPNRKSARPTLTMSSILLQCSIINYQASLTTFPGTVSPMEVAVAAISNSFSCFLIGGSLFPSGPWGSTQQGHAQLLWLHNGALCRQGSPPPCDSAVLCSSGAQGFTGGTEALKCQPISCPL